MTVAARYFILILIFIVSACSGNGFGDEGAETEGYVITGKIKNYDGKKTLKFYDSYAGDTAAEYVIDIKKDGSFHYVGSFEVSTPVLVVYGSPDNALFDISEKLVIFLANGDSIYIEADAEKISQASVTGGSDQKVFQAYNDMIKPYVAALEKDLFKISSEKNPERLQEVQESYDTHLRVFLDLSRDYVSQHANTIAGLYIALNTLPIEENIPIFEHLIVANKDKNSPWVMKLEKTVEMLKPVSIGAEVPDFFAYDSTGKKVSVKDFRGKYLLIDFWASWCQPCRKDHVVLNNIYKELQESDFEILGVSIEKDRTKWLEALKVDNTPWVNIFADEEADTIVKKFHIQSVPHSLLVDKNGKIIAKNVRAFNLKAKLQQARNQ